MWSHNHRISKFPGQSIWEAKKDVGPVPVGVFCWWGAHYHITYLIFALRLENPSIKLKNMLLKTVLLTLTSVLCSHRLSWLCFLMILFPTNIQDGNHILLPSAFFLSQLCLLPPLSHLFSSSQLPNSGFSSLLLPLSPELSTVLHMTWICLLPSVGRCRERSFF